MTQTYTVNVTGADDAPTLARSTVGSIAEVDQRSSTTDSGLSGTLVGADVDVETLTYGIQGGTPSGVDEVSLAGDYGTLTVNTVTGAYSFAKNAAAIEALDDGENDSDVFTVTVSDGDGAAGDADLHGQRHRCGRCADAGAVDRRLDCGSRSEPRRTTDSGPDRHAGRRRR